MKSGLKTIPDLQQSRIDPSIPKNNSRLSKIIKTGRTNPGPVDRGSEVRLLVEFDKLEILRRISILTVSMIENYVK